MSEENVEIVRRYLESTDYQAPSQQRPCRLGQDVEDAEGLVLGDDGLVAAAREARSARDQLSRLEALRRRAAREALS
jgi:hypothetical protein